MALAAVKAALKPRLQSGALDRATFKAAAEAATKVLPWFLRANQLGFPPPEGRPV